MSVFPLLTIWKKLPNGLANPGGRVAPMKRFSLTSFLSTSNLSLIPHQIVSDTISKNSDIPPHPKTYFHSDFHLSTQTHRSIDAKVASPSNSIVWCLRSLLPSHITAAASTRTTAGLVLHVGSLWSCL